MPNENTKPGDFRFIVVCESWTESWLTDAGTFGSLAALLYLNHAALDGNGWVYFTICVCWFVQCLGMASKRRKVFTRQQLRDWARSDVEDIA